jgi:hypothetical protein
MTRKEQGSGNDCLYLAGGLSALMVLASLFLTTVAPAAPGGEGFPIAGVLEAMAEFHFLVFLLVSLVVFGLMQFYFLGTAQFMQDMGIQSKHVPGSMALAQIVQALATLFLFQVMLDNAGFRGTLAFGAVCWVLLYSVYAVGKPPWLIVAVQPLHGLAYVFFVIIGQVFTNSVAPDAIRSSMQALIFAVTTGVGLFLGTQFAGIVMDANADEGKFHWGKVWAVPAAFTLAGVLTLLAVFQDPPSGESPPAAPPAETSVE